MAIKSRIKYHLLFYHILNKLPYKQCSYRFLSLPRLLKLNSILLIKYFLVYQRELIASKCD